jgi:hypothetical protein
MFYFLTFTFLFTINYINTLYANLNTTHYKFTTHLVVQLHDILTVTARDHYDSLIGAVKAGVTAVDCSTTGWIDIGTL